MSELRCRIDLEPNLPEVPPTRWIGVMLRREGVWAQVELRFDRRPLHHYRMDLPGWLIEDNFDRFNREEEPLCKPGQEWVIFPSVRPRGLVRIDMPAEGIEPPATAV